MSKIALFAPSDHYWAVAGDEKNIYPSRRAAFVPADDPEYLAFAERFEVTKIATKQELADVLRDADVPFATELPVAAREQDSAIPAPIRRRLRALEKRLAALEAAKAE